MKTRSARFWLAALALLAGCVPSLNPVYKEKEVRFDPSVLGVWGQPESKARWEFTKHDESSYALAYTDEEGRKGRFIARLADIDGTLFLDLFPQEAEAEASGFYKFHLIPIHTIYLVRRVQPELELAAIDYKWLDNFLTEHPDAIPHATFNGRKLITAPTESVREFVLAHRDSFTGQYKLERLAEPAK
ncbi:MAG: hypothetical protein HYS13_15750 [Planctomycetia bacterium]|nr:hypothetical protein [Planctomycetia bacterium]